MRCYPAVDLHTAVCDELVCLAPGDCTCFSNESIDAMRGMKISLYPKTQFWKSPDALSYSSP